MTVHMYISLLIFSIADGPVEDWTSKLSFQSIDLKSKKKAIDFN